jgi:hypothetical protein
MIVTTPQRSSQVGAVEVPQFLTMPAIPDWIRNLDWKGMLLVGVCVWVVYRALFSGRARTRRKEIRDAETKAKAQYHRQVSKLRERYPVL